MIASNAVGRSVAASPPYSTSSPLAPRRTSAEGTCMKDVVIVGGGLAGLAAGWRLRHWDTVLLESGSRVGGRIRSERRGPVLAELGRARVRRPGIGHRRPAVRGGRHRGAGARLARGRGDERQAADQGAGPDLPVPHPDAAVVARRPHQGRHQGRAARCCGTHASCGSAPARTRPCASSGSTTSRTTAASRTSSATCPRTRGRCSTRRSPARPRTRTRSRPVPGSATSAWSGTSARD